MSETTQPQRYLTETEMMDYIRTAVHELQEEFKDTILLELRKDYVSLCTVNDPPDIYRTSESTFGRFSTKCWEGDKQIQKWFFKVPTKFSVKPTWGSAPIDVDVHFETTEWETRVPTRVKSLMKKSIERWIVLRTTRHEYNKELKTIASKWAFRFSAMG